MQKDMKRAEPRSISDCSRTQLSLLCAYSELTNCFRYGALIKKPISLTKRGFYLGRVGCKGKVTIQSVYLAFPCLVMMDCLLIVIS